MPEHHAWRFLLEVEQVQLLTQLTVIALLCFFYALQILLKIFRRGPRCSVNALQHVIGRIASPVGSGNGRQLKCLEFAGAGYVGAATEINELSLPIKRQILVTGNALDDLDFVVFAHVLEHGHCIGAAHNGALYFQPLFNDLAHDLFYCF